MPLHDQAPTFHKFLTETVGDETIINSLSKRLGVALVSGNIHSAPDQPGQDTGTFVPELDN